MNINQITDMMITLSDLHEIEIIDVEQDQPPLAAQVPPPLPPAAQVPPPQAQPTPEAPARRGRRRRAETASATTPARRTRSNTTEGETTRGNRPSRSSSRNAFYGNGDSEDDFIL